jgi:hypothetical protein
LTDYIRGLAPVSLTAANQLARQALTRTNGSHR